MAVASISPSSRPAIRPPARSRGSPAENSTRLRQQQIEIDRLAHGEIAGAIRVQPVAGAAGRALGHELGAQLAGLRIDGGAVEIGDAVEQAAGADELVERLALGILLGEAVRGV